MAIPGVTTLIRDRFYSVSRQDAPVGPRIVVIAKRDNADGTGGVPDLDVVRVSNEADAITAFGDGSDAHRAFVELVTAGAERIFIVPLPSDTVFDHTLCTVTSTAFGGSVFDAAFVAAESAVPDMIIPWGRGAETNDWSSNNVATPSDDREFGFHADNNSAYATNWAYKVGVAVKSISENTNPCLAIMGVKPFLASQTVGGLGTTERMTPSQTATKLTLTGLPDRDATDAWKSVGPYISIIVTEIKPVNYKSGTTDFGFSNGAAFLAASLSRLPSYSSVVNKPLYNIEALRYAPTRTQQQALSTKGVNTVVLNFNKVAVFGEGLTFGQTTSDYTRLSTKRIVDEASLVIRQVCQKFIGEPSNIQVRNAMETAITSGLRGMQLMGALLGSDFTVSYVPNQNKAIVDLILTPAFELKTIEVQVAINL
jgi:hypothetical protein